MGPNNKFINIYCQDLENSDSQENINEEFRKIK